MIPDPAATAVALLTPVSVPVERARPDMRLLGLRALGHVIIDVIADRWRLMSALWISALMPLGGFAAALFVPEPRAR